MYIRLTQDFKLHYEDPEKFMGDVTVHILFGRILRLYSQEDLQVCQKMEKFLL